VRENRVAPLFAGWTPRGIVFEPEVPLMSTENIIIIVVIVLIVLFVLGYFGRGRLGR